MSWLLFGLTGDSILGLDLAGLRVDGLDVPEDDQLCKGSRAGGLWGPLCLLLWIAALSSGRCACEPPPFC